MNDINNIPFANTDDQWLALFEARKVVLLLTNFDQPKSVMIGYNKDITKQDLIDLINMREGTVIERVGNVTTPTIGEIKSHLTIMEAQKMFPSDADINDYHFYQVDVAFVEDDEDEQQAA